MRIPSEPVGALWAVLGQADVHTPMLTCGAGTPLARRWHATGTAGRDGAGGVPAPPCPPRLWREWRPAWHETADRYLDPETGTNQESSPERPLLSVPGVYRLAAAIGRGWLS